MTKEKFEIPIELDAAVLQYASEKKFVRRRWYWSVPVRAAAAAAVALGLAYMQFFQAEKRVENTVQTAEAENFDWNDFEAKLEFVDEAIFDEARYLAQL